MAKWIEERRKKQAEAIKRWKPWEKSTSPKTREGKEKASLNALKNGAHAAPIKELIAAFRNNRDFFNHINNYLLAEQEQERIKNRLLENDEKSDE